MNMGYELTTMKNADQQISLLKTVEKHYITEHHHPPHKQDLTDTSCTYIHTDGQYNLLMQTWTYKNYKLVYTVLIGKILSWPSFSFYIGLNPQKCAQCALMYMYQPQKCAPHA